jgi:hypothetical protein
VSEELSPGHYAARVEQANGYRYHLATRLERLAQLASLIAVDLREGNPLRHDDTLRLTKRVESVWEAIAIERATRP